MDKFKDWVSKLHIMPLFWGVFICYCGQFAASLLTTFMGFSAPAVDIVNHPELASAPQHPIFRPLVGAAVTLGAVVVAGYISGMLAGVREKQHALTVGAIFTILSIPYCIDTAHELVQHGNSAVDSWGDWLWVTLAIPAAYFGAVKYVQSIPPKSE